VNTIVLIRPICRATQGAASCEAAESSPAQKKNWPAAASESSKRSNSQSASKVLTIKPPAKASTENSAASLITTPRDGPRAAGGPAWSCPDESGNARYRKKIATPASP